MKTYPKQSYYQNSIYQISIQTEKKIKACIYTGENDANDHKLFYNDYLKPYNHVVFEYTKEIYTRMLYAFLIQTKIGFNSLKKSNYVRDTIQPD